jgi:DNA invertase Pin-like site-specific DNA recombinase
MNPSKCQTLRAALYGRVSTDDQDESMQRREMLEMCSRRSWEPAIFEDHGWSGAKEHRPELDRMLALCRKGKFDVVMVYRFDRFARSVKQLVGALAEFESLGVQFVSVHEQIDTTTPQGRFFFHIFAALAEFERELTRSRIHSKLSQRKQELQNNGFFISKKGRRCTRLGRPRCTVNGAEVLALRSSGASIRAIAAQLNSSIGTISRMIAGGSYVQAEN